ncbi:uncharacterized protein LOC129693573 [Leucoraja erinacea]|uniref:uncharacterized protein LOC129693573 n=1 Tax=Leucoraja erinaceus TaxID=7782 RepID=UPI00245517AA|nr:uncharacterized protein LOC129693573 [Leucoraja erinacea]
MNASQTQYLTQARLGRYELTLLNNPNLTFQHCSTINPSAFLTEPPEPCTEPPHNCEMANDLLTKTWEGLSDIPLEGNIPSWFVDGSSMVIPETGQRASGYAVVNGSQMILEEGRFQIPLSAQQAELFALTRACILATDKQINIYTDSRYAFGVAHDFGALWQHRGFLTSAGTPIKNALFVRNLLMALMLPEQLAIIKCTAHTGAGDPIAKGNEFAYSVSKQAACTSKCVVTSDKQIRANRTVLPDMREVCALQRDASDNQTELETRGLCH